MEVEHVTDCPKFLGIQKQILGLWNRLRSSLRRVTLPDHIVSGEEKVIVPPGQFLGHRGKSSDLARAVRCPVGSPKGGHTDQVLGGEDKFTLQLDWRARQRQFELVGRFLIQVLVIQLQLDVAELIGLAD